jgi:hypothetical protein
MELEIRVRADLAQKIELVSLKAMCVKTEVQQDRHQCLRICPDSQTQLMHRSLLAVKYQAERFFLTQELVCDIVI